MFTVAESNHTISYVIGGAIALMFIAVLARRLYLKNGYTFFDLLILPLFLGVAWIAVYAPALTADRSVYKENVAKVESYFEDKYSGDFKIVSKTKTDHLVENERINFAKLDDVESQRVNVERDTNDAVYVYRLRFDSDGNPSLKELVTGDRSDYPPLSE